MRVAVVVNSLKLGGMERVACSLTDAFAKQGHDAHLIYLKNRQIEVTPSHSNTTMHLFDLKKWVLLSGIGLIWLVVCRLLNVIFRKTFSMFFAYAEAVAFAYKLNRLEKRIGRFDLIVFRGHGTFSHVWPLQDKRFVFVCESTQNKAHFGAYSKRIFTLLFSHRRMVCVSDGARESFMDLIESFQIPCQSIHTITNPNDYDKIRQEAACLVDSVEYHKKPYILGLGRLVPGKNFPLLIEAYHYARQHYGIQHDLVIVGEGREREKIKQTIKQFDLEDYVFLKGQQNNPFPWYQQADLFVLSSTSEGLGMVLIEALACGTSVVATNCPGGVGDIMQGKLKNFLAQQTPDSLAEKIALALQEDTSPELTADIAKALQQFDEAHIVEQYIQAYFATENTL
ncbi:N-acetylgalactosamine-N, N'-diacetylbacillosaminyl-diphospho-undecaprenol 4-alpha-N-acetylgalactosaminyltransferase [Marinomonas spartinae]|uniref:glycosyltransferase n=1 Tax=Marinomonas spartinae TaxID=1792290 RepID=UPI000808E66C|nr:glycosyltransferase [Marinomonas spartinae]SBS32907.1 N-acetylgalactosamine-N, N'-diacetylbacillosaminyl-diphospho-undecaprenol 4-alpha-N-acetylgalactosaminyltransferase [Marinomonas spartinae]